MDAAGGPGDRAMSCAISTTPATSAAVVTTTMPAPATTIAATATADRGLSFAAGSHSLRPNPGYRRPVRVHMGSHGPWHASVFRRRNIQGSVDHLPQLFDQKWFLQRGLIAIFRRNARRAVTGRENERKISCLYQFGHRCDHVAIDVDVEDGKLEFGRLGKLDGVANF